LFYQALVKRLKCVL